jgi:Ca2+-binding EF-hand superfamily protein
MQFSTNSQNKTPERKVMKMNYSEYLTKVVKARKEINEDNLKKIFQQLDHNNTGIITQEDLERFYKRKGVETFEPAVQEFFNEAREIKSSTSTNMKSQFDPNASQRESEMFQSLDMHESPHCNRISYDTFKTLILDSPKSTNNVKNSNREKGEISMPKLSKYQYFKSTELTEEDHMKLMRKLSHDS